MIVSIVIPCLNEFDSIERVVSDCFNQKTEHEIEVIVVDGGSNDGTKEKLDTLSGQFDKLVVLDNPKKFQAAALNVGIERASGSVIVRMDAHTRYADDYVQACIDVMEETGADNVGGPARTETRGYLQGAIAAAFHSKFSTGGAAFHDPEYEGPADTITYGCWPRETIQEIGGFDEEMIRNEDDELNLRLHRAGKKLWQSPRIRSWYSPRSSLAHLFKQYQQYGYYKVKVIQKHRIPASIRHLVPGAMVVGFGTLAAGSLFSNIARLGLFAAGTAYGTVITAASVQTASKTKWRYLPVLPIIFASYHWGYGLGYVRGMMDFMVLKRDASGKFQVLTREQ